MTRALQVVLGHELPRQHAPAALDQEWPEVQLARGAWRAPKPLQHKPQDAEEADQQRQPQHQAVALDVKERPGARSALDP